MDSALDAIGKVDRRVAKVEGILETLQVGNVEDFTGLNASLDSVHTTIRDIGRRIAEIEGTFGALVFRSPPQGDNPFDDLPQTDPRVPPTEPPTGP